jgi:hypothetical protein
LRGVERALDLERAQPMVSDLVLLTSLVIRLGAVSRGVYMLRRREELLGIKVYGTTLMVVHTIGTLLMNIVFED